MALDKTRLKASMVAKIEAIADFPRIGQHPIIRDDRVLGAIAEAIVEEIVGFADVLVSAHSGESLSTASGTPSTGNDPQGGVVHSTVDADTEIVGKGSIL